MILAPLVHLAYRADAIIDILMIVSRVFLFYVLWSAVFHAGEVRAGFDAHEAITYSTVAALLVGQRARPVDSFSDRITAGTIGYLFSRPLSPLQYYWGFTLGSIVYRLAWVTIGAAIAMIFGVVTPPTSFVVVAAAVASIILAEVIYGYLFLFLQLISFWTIEIAAIQYLYIFVIQLLSGALVPLWFFPHWARHLLLWLPFAGAVSTPISIYVGRIPTSEVAGALALQLGWLVAFTALARLMWEQVERRVVVQGG
jgi:ABC-2 type transport system permease protein